jgi:predicted kinase
MGIAGGARMSAERRPARRAAGRVSVASMVQQSPDSIAGEEKQLVVFVGLPSSGKSSFYASRYAATHVHVSKDLFGHARHKQDRQMRLVEQALRTGRSVVVDNTNPRKADRAPLVFLARAFGATPIAVWFTAPVADCLRRNAAREGKARVPAVAIYTAARKLEPPTPDEGFAHILEARLGDAGFDVRGQDT